MPFFHIFHTYSTTSSNNIATDLYSANVNWKFAFWVSHAWHKDTFTRVCTQRNFHCVY